jgi:hypothetical protein
MRLRLMEIKERGPTGRKIKIAGLTLVSGKLNAQMYKIRHAGESCG